jgi:hypothetical protein
MNNDFWFEFWVKLAAAFMYPIYIMFYTIIMAICGVIGIVLVGSILWLMLTTW